ncbi:MAG: flavodoxin family protein [Candidatus Magnetoovum sp. WYHC-5]|nr:flavodoxin family protein [Candidatus Magnetoovum sp. WYHC-5]
MKVLGVSGSPVNNSNTDRALKAALEATGCETEYVKLVDYDVAPCKACLGCVGTNVCVQKDDGVMLAQKAKEASALIIAAYTPYSSIDARTKAFIERLYQLRHFHAYMSGKPGGAIVTTSIPDNNAILPQAGDLVVNSIMYYMIEEGMNFVGAVKVLGNVPCVRCGIPDCNMNGVKMIFGEGISLKSVGINNFEMQHKAVESAMALGVKIGKTLKKQINI